MNLQEKFEDMLVRVNNDGLGYYLMHYTDSNSMPDEKSRRLFEDANKALKEFETYITDKANP